MNFKTVCKHTLSWICKYMQSDLMYSSGAVQIGSCLAADIWYLAAGSWCLVVGVTLTKEILQELIGLTVF